MSVKVMSAVWECDALDASERLVMLSLADHADDQGRCYPSVARLSRRTSMTGRGVQKVIARLVERGFIRIQPNAGQSGANVYSITATPAADVSARALETVPRGVDANLRWKIYKRDAYRCRYCGFQGHEDGHDLTVDHIVPVSKGGNNAEGNLNTCCFSCNSSKKDKDLDAWLMGGVNPVHPEPRSPRTTFTTPPNPVRNTPEPRSPKPSGTIIEPSIEAAPRRRRKPEVPIPPNWVPNEKNLSDAEARQFSAMEIQDEAERFRDHHLAKGSRFRDWDAAWRTWLGNARRFAPRRGTTAGRGGMVEAFASVAAARSGRA